MHGRGQRSATHSHVFLLAKEAHSDVVPELRRLGGGSGRHSVLSEGHVVVTMVLNHGTCCQNGLGVGGGEEGECGREREGA